MLSRIWQVWRTLISHYRQHKSQALFLLTGLSLGVAILLGTLIVGKAAKTAFAKAEQTVAGNIVGYIRPANGRNSLPEQLYVDLRLAGFSHLMPQVEGRIEFANGRFATLQGIDLFALFHSTSGDHSSSSSDENYSSLSLLDFSYPPYQLWVSETLTSIHNLTPKKKISLKSGRQLPALVTVSDSLGTGYNLLCDIRCAQDILSLQQNLSAIALTRMPADVEQLKAALPDNARLVMVGKNVQNQALSDAFFLNITAVSMLAFLVGCFIAFNAVRFSVLQRTRLVQQLRMTGVTFNEVAGALLAELLFWALLASLLGCLLGWFIASQLLPSVGLTLVQLFQGKNLLDIGQLQQWWLYALIISLGATLIAVARPFWQLAQTKPLQTATVPGNKNLSVIPALLVIGLGYALTWLPPSQMLGFAVTSCWFFGGALLVPYMVVTLYRVLSKGQWLKRYPKIQWLVADGHHNHGRLSVAMMAFAVAIAAGIAVSTKVSSFQIALKHYLDQVLAEDLYLQPNHNKAADIADFLQNHPDVQLAYRFYHTSTAMSKDDISFGSFVRGITNDEIRHRSIALERQVANVWEKLHHREGIVVNQTLAFQQRLNIGDMLVIKAGNQSVEVKVLGVYYSYGATISSFIMNQQWLKSLWPGVETSEVGVFLKSGKAIDPLIEQLKQQFGVASSQAIKPQTIKALALKIFAQTFEATKLLTIFTLLIAAIGIYCACYCAQLDQQRSLSLLKLLGIDHKSLTGLVGMQLFCNTAVAALIALPLGLAIAWASVNIVLQYSFGWHFAIIVDFATVGSIMLGAIIIALLAGILPTYQLGKRNQLQAFREAT